MRVATALVMVALATALVGCSGVRLVIHTPIPIEQKKDYHREYTYGGKDVFYYHSYLYIVNASRYRVRIVQNGVEIPSPYGPGAEIKIKAKNHVHADSMTHIQAVAYGRHGEIVGIAEKSFLFNGTGKQQVEQWVLKDWMFDR